MDQYFKHEQADDLDREFVDEFNDLYRKCIKSMTPADIREGRQNIEKAKVNFKKFRKFKNIYMYLSRFFIIVPILTLNITSLFSIISTLIFVSLGIFIYFKHERNLRERQNFHYGLIFSIQWEIDEHFRLNSKI